MRSQKSVFEETAFIWVEPWRSEQNHCVILVVLKHLTTLNFGLKYLDLASTQILALVFSGAEGVLSHHLYSFQ